MAFFLQTKTNTATSQAEDTPAIGAVMLFSDGANGVATPPSLVGNNADGEATVATGLVANESYNMVFNGTTWDRQRSGSQAVGNSTAVALPIDLTITGQASTTTGNNALAADGATATTATSYHSGSVQIIGSAGIASGAVTFEQSNNGTDFTLLPVQENTATAQTIQVSAITIAANSARIFSFQVNAAYIRCRVSTGFSGGTIQCFTVLSQLPFAGPAVTVFQATGSSLNAQVTGAVAHSSNATGNPVLTAGRCFQVPDQTITNADTVTVQMSFGHQLVTTEGAGAQSTWNYAAGSGGITTATGVTARASAGAGLRNYVRSAQISCINASNANELTITDGNAGTVLWRFPAGVGLPVSATVNFTPPLQGAAATLVEVKLANASANGFYVNMQGWAAYAP